jgi:hypothetical protein
MMQRYFYPTVKPACPEFHTKDQLFYLLDGSAGRPFLVILLSLSLCFISSCKKSAPEETPSESPVQQTAAEQPAQQEKVETPAGDVNDSSEKTAGGDAEGGLVPIEIELPKAMFVGTPQPAQVLNLEKPLGKARPPFLAPIGTKNVARGKPITSSDEMPIIGELEYVTDGDKEAADGCYVELGPSLQHVTIDLEAKYEIYAVVVWHYHKQGHVYFDVVVQVADDPDFITNVNTIFNNDADNSAGLGVGKDMHYVETYEGKLIDAKGVQGRYVRLYSNGNHINDMNHYIEVEVYGKPIVN